MSTRATSDQSVLPLQSWPSRSYVAVFVRCLHLLDLDLLEDWPAVTEQLFAAKTAQQNLQQRVKAVEWSLFRLFEIFDPQETKDKLRPFFPPTSQLQSLNLRAALYRCLTELKKNGVLAKDVSLRKTMLDDCKGERFEEVIASLAMSTLRKAAGLPADVAQKDPTSGRSLTMHLAYRASLRNSLLARKEAYLEGMHQLERLKILQDHLHTRLEDSKANCMKTDIATLKKLQVLVNTSWIGNSTWIDILLLGVLEKSVLDAESSEPASSFKNESQKLLEDLEERIQTHHTRLSQWKVIAKDLSSRQRQERTTVKLGLASKGQAETTLRFQEHKSLNLSEWKADRLARRPIESSYQSLINSMKQDFSGTVTASKRPEFTQATSISASVTSTAEHSPSSFLEDFDGRADNRRSPTKPSDTDVVAVAADEDDTGSTRHDSSERSDSPSPIRSDDGDSLWIPRRPSGTTTVAAGNFKLVQGSNPPTSSTHEDPASLSKMWMSLADRTRASISFTGRQSILNDPDSPVSQENTQPVEAILPELHPPSDDDRHSTLVERTRKSMSVFSGLAASRPKKSRAESRTSQVFPVNQFETPGRPQRHSDRKPESGASTPREQLFEGEAEYASVFKSRPKLALSPAFSPERRTSDYHNNSERDMEQLDLDSDVD